jgi:hypothetical protein
MREVERDDTIKQDEIKARPRRGQEEVKMRSRRVKNK